MELTKVKIAKNLFNNIINNRDAAIAGLAVVK